MSKKLLIVCVVIAMVASLLTGCKSSGKEEPTSKNNEVTKAAEEKSDDKAADVATPEKVKYPVNQLTITCPPASGGGTDLLLRAMAPAMSEYLGVPVVVVNKPGAGCAIGYSAGAKDKNDGSSITAAVAEMLSVPQMQDVDFTYKSFEVIANMNSCYGALTVTADAPYNTLEEFIAYAKENPGKIRIGNSGIGSNWHILAASFAAEAGIDVVHVPFDGAGPAGVALAGGHIEAVPVSPQEVDVHVKAGNAKILCTFSPERLPELPDLPTGKELGYGNTVLTIFRGLVAPLGTSQEVISMIDQAVQYALDDPAVTEFMEAQHFMKDYMNAKDFTALMERENAIYEEQFKALGLVNK